jgi:signal transduction histidine kinase
MGIPRVDTVTRRQTGSSNQVEALDALARELAAVHDPSEVAERALAGAIDLLHASIVFIGLDDESGGARRFYSRAAGQATRPSDDEVDGLLKAAASATGVPPASENGHGSAALDSFCGQELVAGGRAIGTMGALSPSGFTAAQRSTFAVLASQVAASFEIARLGQRRQEMVDALVNVRADLDRSEKQRVVIEERARSAERLEKAHEMAIESLLAVSAHIRSGDSLTDSYGHLSAAVARLVGADKVLFWQLQDPYTLTAIPGGHGIDREFIKRLHPGRCDPDGDDLASRVVYKDSIFRAARADGSPESTRVLDILGVSSAISVPWRAGEQRLGVVAAYDSSRPDGFSREDAWVLQMAGLAAGLVWQLKHAESDLTRTVARLQKVDAARQLLLRNASTAVDKARKRFANELHDDALQKLTAAELRLQRVSDRTNGSDQTPIGDVQSLLLQAEEALRRLLFEVRPPALDIPGGFDETIRDRVTMLRSLTGIEADVVLEVPDDLSYELKSTTFRQVAEALTNVEKHASAKTVRVSVTEKDGGIHGMVVDDGCGFVVAERDHLPGHLGLLALNERALLSGGWCTIESEPGIGTKVEFWFPTSS